MFLTLNFGQREEKELIVNPQQELNKEELSESLPFCALFLPTEKGRAVLFTEFPSWVSPGPRAFLWTTSFHAYHTLVREGLLPLFFRGGNCGLKYLCHLPEITQPGNDRGRI